MSVTHCPERSSTGWPLCPDCSDEMAPWDDHGACDFTALKSLAASLSQGAFTMPTCPRCSSTNVAGSLIESSSGQAIRSRCRDCTHCWGDGLPDSQDRPLPDGMVDCDECEGTGEAFPMRTCRCCDGDGIMLATLLG